MSPNNTIRIPRDMDDIFNQYPSPKLGKVEKAVDVPEGGAEGKTPPPTAASAAGLARVEKNQNKQDGPSPAESKFFVDNVPPEQIPAANAVLKKFHDDKEAADAYLKAHPYPTPTSRPGLGPDQLKAEQNDWMKNLADADLPAEIKGSKWAAVFRQHLAGARQVVDLIYEEEGKIEPTTPEPSPSDPKVKSAAEPEASGAPKEEPKAVKASAESKPETSSSPSSGDSQAKPDFSKIKDPKLRAQMEVQFATEGIQHDWQTERDETRHSWELDQEKRQRQREVKLKKSELTYQLANAAVQHEMQKEMAGLNAMLQLTSQLITSTVNNLQQATLQKLQSMDQLTAQLVVQGQLSGKDIVMARFGNQGRG